LHNAIGGEDKSLLISNLKLGGEGINRFEFGSRESSFKNKEMDLLNIDKNKMLSELKRIQWAMYVICVLAYMLTLFHRITPAIMGPDLMQDLQLNAVSFGFMGLAFTWVYAFAQAPVGTMLDTLGPRKGITAILVLAAVGGVVFSVAETFPVLIIGRVLLALAVSGFLIGGAKILSVWFTTKQYPVLWGLFMGLGALGSVFGTSPLRSMMSSYGWRSSMLGIGIFSLVLAIIAYMILRDKPADKGLLTPDELADEVVATKTVIKTIEEKVSIKTVLSMPILWLIGLLSLGVNSSSQTFGSMWEGIYLASVFGFDKTAIGGILVWYAWGLVIGCFASGPIVRMFGSQKTMLAGTIAFLINWLFIAIQPGSMGITGLQVFNFFMGSLQMVVISTTFIFIREVIPVSRLGTAMGIVNSFAWILGAGIFQQLWGFIINSISKGVQPYPLEAFQVALWVQMIMITVGVLCAFYIWRKYNNTQQNATTNVEV